MSLARRSLFEAVGKVDVAAFCAPLIVTEAETDEMFARFGRALKRM